MSDFILLEEKLTSKICHETHHALPAFNGSVGSLVAAKWTLAMKDSRTHFSELNNRMHAFIGLSVSGLLDHVFESTSAFFLRSGNKIL